MRLATLDDISGASSWDVATFFALHGSVHNTLDIVLFIRFILILALLEARYL